MAKLLGILGGTFDPIHYGHLKPAADLKQALNLEQVLFIPNKVPPHREQPWLDADTRKRLIEQAIQDYPGFKIDLRELRREGLSYMVDTLQSLHEDFPEHRLCLIMGMDAFAGFTQWHQWQAILKLCHLIIVSRPGVQLPDFGEHQTIIQPLITSDAHALDDSLHGQILIQSVSLIDISATMIRERLSQHQSIADLVPDSIRGQLETRYAT